MNYRAIEMKAFLYVQLLFVLPPAAEVPGFYCTYEREHRKEYMYEEEDVTGTVGELALKTATTVNTILFVSTWNNNN